MSKQLRRFHTTMETVDEQEENNLYAKRTLLVSLGWKESSALPGSLWLWSKSFPESKTQGRWAKNGGLKEPSPPFTVNGTTLEVALTIERSWLELWDDARDDDGPPAPDGGG